jgi:DNA gyrase subunit B
MSGYYDALRQLENQGFDERLIDALIRQGVEDKKVLQDEPKMLTLCELLRTLGYVVDPPSWNADRDVFEIAVERGNGSASRSTSIKVGRALIYSMEYQKCLAASKNMITFDQSPFVVISGENESATQSFDNKRQLLSHLIEEGKKGISIQRYKGLGEMNPEQLWQTTMNPEKRILLQVGVFDAVESNEIFTILMGDEVEPRREFIQNNALEVSTLDI